MNVSAKLIELLPEQSGTSRNGEWKKRDIIVETEEQFPKKLCISLWSDKFSDIVLRVGNLYEINFDLQSREYNGKWYTDIRAVKIQVKDSEVSKMPEVDNFIMNTSSDDSDDEIWPF